MAEWKDTEHELPRDVRSVLKQWKGLKGESYPMNEKARQAGCFFHTEGADPSAEVSVEGVF